MGDLKSEIESEIEIEHSNHFLFVQISLRCQWAWCVDVMNVLRERDEASLLLTVLDLVVCLTRKGKGKQVRSRV